MMAEGFRRFRDDGTVVVFAAGVSDSTESSPGAFERERRLLEQTIARDPGRRFVYFSTCSILDPDASGSAYVRHKAGMEERIALLSRDFLVFRLPQVVGPGGNRANLVNYLHGKIRSGEPFVVWTRAVRYVIDIDDVVRLAEPAIRDRGLTNRIVPVVSVPCTVLDIVRALERAVGKKARYTEVAKGSSYAVPQEALPECMRRSGVVFGEDYLEKTIRKYYS
jgi:nucleoside-diphosphate-sugar epimerase